MQSTEKILSFVLGDNTENHWSEGDGSNGDIHSGSTPGSNGPKDVTALEGFNHNEKIMNLGNIEFSGMSCGFGDLSAIESSNEDLIDKESRHSKSPSYSPVEINRTEMDDFHIISSATENKNETGNLLKFNSVKESSCGSPVLENNLSLIFTVAKTEKYSETFGGVTDGVIKKYEGTITKEVAKFKDASVQTSEDGFTFDAHCQCDLYQISSTEYPPRKITKLGTFDDLSARGGGDKRRGQLPENLLRDHETNVQVKNDWTPRNCNTMPRIRVGLSKRIKPQPLHNF